LCTLLFLLNTRPPPTSTLFPYTTLFRSREPRNRLTETALRAAQAAGRVLMKFFLGKAENFREFKGRNDLVTSADLESCRIIKKRSEEHTSELQSRENLVCRLLLEKKKHT